MTTNSLDLSERHLPSLGATPGQEDNHVIIDVQRASLYKRESRIIAKKIYSDKGVPKPGSHHVTLNQYTLSR